MYKLLHRIKMGAALAAISLLPFQTGAAQYVNPPLTPGQENDDLIVKFKDDARDDQIADALNAGSLHVHRHVQTGEMHARNHVGLTHVSSALGGREALKKLKNHPAVDYVEPNYTYTHQTTSNDPYVTGGSLWGMYGDLSAPGNAFGSQAAEAWAAGHTGSTSVYVGIVDEGIEIQHPDLASNIWQNPFETADGLDNDGNGYKDDVNGFDFHGNTPQVFDAAAGDDHGTHVAGTIGGKGGNGFGVAGVNWSVTIIPAKFMSAGSGNTLDAVEAIDYLVDLKKRHGLNIVAINASWGGGGYSQSLHDSIIRAAKAGILFIAAAGNGDASGNGLNNDTTPSYPANIDTRVGTSTETAASYDSVISVAAIDQNGAKASFSNYGATKVHLGAPGVAIYSTLPMDTYGAYNGTSMATPHVTGAAALYASTHPTATAQQIRDAILNSVTPTASLAGKTVTGGRLNLSSIIAPVVVIPAAPTGLTAAAGNTTATLTWVPSANAATYTVKRATVHGGPYTVVASGLTTTSYLNAGLQNGVTYYYVVTAVNTDGESAKSNEASAQPTAPVAPPVPTGVTATAGIAKVAGTASVSVKWNASTGAASYLVKRATSSSGPYLTIASGVTALTFTDTVVANGARYYYVVTAAAPGIYSANSAAASTIAQPPAPTSLAAVAVSSSQVTLSWLDKSSDEQGFKLEYSLNGSTWSQLGTTVAGTTSVNVTGTTSLTTYFFRSRAYNGLSNTAYSNVARITMP